MRYWEKDECIHVIHPYILDPYELHFRRVHGLGLGLINVSADGRASYLDGYNDMPIFGLREYYHRDGGWLFLMRKAARQWTIPEFS